MKRIILILVCLCFLTSMGFASTISKEAWSSAYKKLLAGDYVGAREGYGKILSLVDPGIGKVDYAQAQFHIAYCFEQEKNTVEAINAYAEVCLKYASVKDMRVEHLLETAFSRIDPAVLGTEKYLQVIGALLLGVDYTDETESFILKLKRQEAKFK